MCDLNEYDDEIECELAKLIGQIENMLNCITTSDKGIDFIQAETVRNLVKKFWKEHEVKTND